MQWQRHLLPKLALGPPVGCHVPLGGEVRADQKALNLSPHYLSAPEELDQRDAHPEDKNPGGVSPEAVWDPCRVGSSSNEGQSSLGALVVAGPVSQGIGPWVVGVEPGGVAQHPWPQAVEVMGALEQEGWDPVGVAATVVAVAASKAALAADAGIGEAATSGIWDSLVPG